MVKAVASQSTIAAGQLCGKMILPFSSVWWHLLLEHWYFVCRPVTPAKNVRRDQVPFQLCGIEKADLSAEAEESVLVAAPSRRSPNPGAGLLQDIAHVTIGAFRAFDGSTVHGAADCTPLPGAGRLSGHRSCSNGTCANEVIPDGHRDSEPHPPKRHPISSELSHG